MKGARVASGWALPRGPGPLREPRQELLGGAFVRGRVRPVTAHQMQISGRQRDSVNSRAATNLRAPVRAPGPLGAPLAGPASFGPA